MIYIYALRDPFTQEIRYIGKTINLQERLRTQCNEKSNTYRCHWIQMIIAKGKKPIQVILEELPNNADWQQAEKDWILNGKKEGWKLTNTTDGGDGVLNLSGESKERMLKTWKGRKHSPESIIKIGAASRGRKHTEEYKKMMKDKMSVRVFTETHRNNLSTGRKKLSEDQIKQVIELRKNNVRQIDLAEMFGVHKDTIQNITRGKLKYSKQILNEAI